MARSIDTAPRAGAQSAAAPDDAFDRVSALDFEIPNPFVNHAPMTCEALVALHMESTLDAWVERFGSSMGRAVTPVTPDWTRNFDWKDRIGDHRLLPEWMGYFERSISDEGWPAVVDLWVPRLVPGLAAALFHGVIRTSHAVRAIDAVDTGPRRAELARALGNWAVWFTRGEPVGDRVGHGDVGLQALTCAASGAHSYAAEPTIVNLHGVTGAMAVHLLAGHLGPADSEAAVAQLRAELRSLYREVHPVTGDDGAEWNDRTVVAASESHDPHQVKLVEACRRGFRLTGDSGFARAAETVTFSAG